MTEATAEYLVSEPGQKLLTEVAALPPEDAQRVLRLRKRGVPADIAAAAVEVAAARWRARFRFADASRLYFTASALAQATSEGIAAYRASCLAPLGTVADLGCGVGIDAIALATAGARVIAVERDPVRIVFARANAVACGVSERICFITGDVADWNGEADALFADPSRRTADGQRHSDRADRYEPPLDLLTQAIRRCKGGCLKLSPALPDSVLDSLGGGVEFLSERRECKEACVWFGAANGSAAGAKVSAVLLPERLAVIPSEISPAVQGVGAYIHDPDPALIRAGALGALAVDGAALVSRHDTYLASDAPLTVRRMASTYQVVESMRFQRKEAARWLRKKGYGRIVVKKRHFSQEPEALCRELGLTGDGAEITLILIRDDGHYWAVFCEPAPDTMHTVTDTQSGLTNAYL